MHRILSHLGNPICMPSFHAPARDSRATPGPVRQDRSARSCHGPATVRSQARFPRRGSGARTPRATGAPHYVSGHPGQRSASKAHDRDRPAGYPGATCHRPPVDQRACTSALCEGAGYGQQAQSTTVARHASRRNPSPAEVDDRNNDPLCTVGISALVCKKAGPAVVRALGAMPLSLS
jgi:hypothetical protein